MSDEVLYTREITIYALVDKVYREHVYYVLEQISLALGVEFTDITSPKNPVVFQFKCYTSGFIKKRSVAEKKLEQLLREEREIRWNVSYRESSMSEAK
jgi:hypothetical protein